MWLIDNRATAHKSFIKPISQVTFKFGARVRELRMAKGLSQKDFAEMCQLDRTYVSSLEHGKRNICLKNIAVIAVVLEVSLSQLFEKVVFDE